MLGPIAWLRLQKQLSVGEDSGYLFAVSVNNWYRRSYGMPLADIVRTSPTARRHLEDAHRAHRAAKRIDPEVETWVDRWRQSYPQVSREAERHVVLFDNPFEQ